MINLPPVAPTSLRTKGGPKTWLGVQAWGFPNIFVLMGPHTALGNIPRNIESNDEWVTGVIRHMRSLGLTRAECSRAGVAAWTEHVKSLGVGLLSNEIDSWMPGINRDVEGKNERIISRYSGSAPTYRARCGAVAEVGYREPRLV